MDDPGHASHFAANLLRLRRRRGLTQVEMARLCGSSLGTLRAMERGRAPAHLVLPAAEHLAQWLGSETEKLFAPPESFEEIL